jgi:hypothetical protein
VLFVTSHVWFAAHPHWGVSPHALLGATVAHVPASTAPELLPPELLLPASVPPASIAPELLPPELLPPELL